MHCAYLSIQIIFWLHFICHIITIKILYNHMYFVFPERFHRFLINTQSPFSNTVVNGPLLPCLAVSLRFLQDEFVDAILYAWPILFLQSSTNLERVCWVVLLLDSNIRSISNLGFGPNKKIWSIACCGVLGSTVCVDYFLKIIFPYFFSVFSRVFNIAIINLFILSTWPLHWGW